METNNKKRNTYIDIMKGLLITLVVIGHLPYFEYNSRTLTLIYSFHMHSFLIIGGILSHVIDDTKASTIILKKIRSTLIPYFVFYLITFIIVPTSLDQKINAIPVVIKGIGIPPDHALNLPLWFLTFYFVVMTAFELIQFISYKVASVINNSLGTKTIPYRKKLFYDNILPILISFIFIVIIMRISFVYARIYKLPRLPYNIEIAGFCLGFVFFGNVLKKIIPNIYNKYIDITSNGSSKNNKLFFFKIIINFILILVLIMILKTWYEYSMWNGRIDLNARDYKNAFYMYVDAILGFILFASLTWIMNTVAAFANVKINHIFNHTTNFSNISILNKTKYILLYIFSILSKLFSYLGRNSIYILAYHVPSVYYSNRFIIPYLPISIRETLSHNSLISIMIMSFFGIAFSLIMSHIHKFFIRQIKNRK